MESISIHAAREGGDQQKAAENQAAQISIHAAREGGDAFPWVSLPNCFDFNPRRP